MPREKPDHPSLYHYRTERCRCQQCRYINSEKRRQERLGVAMRPADWTPGKGKGMSGVGGSRDPMDEETLMRLRRMVGLI